MTSIQQRWHPVWSTIVWHQLALNALLIVSWLWLFSSLSIYFRTVFTRQDFRTNQIVLLLIVGLIAKQLVQNPRAIRIDRAPRVRAGPLLIVVGSAAGFWLSERLFDINVVSAMLFIFGSYGLLGLWMAPTDWRNRLPIAILIAGTLPINTHIQTFVGYPLRVATAALVRDMLTYLGVTSVGVDTILVLENGLTHVDVPCSGVSSLWTGGMFLLAATWLENKRLSWGWFGIVLLLMILLVLANLMRVTILVLVGSVWGIPLLADMLHVPIGVLGFVGCCAVALLFLRRTRSHQITTAPLTGASIRSATSLTVGLIGMCVLLALTYKSTVRETTLGTAPAWAFTTPFELTAYPLDGKFWSWLERDGARSADRHRFQYGDLSGTMLFVVSSNWHAHHNPERCFQGSGLQTNGSATLFVENKFPARRMQLGTPAGDERSAIYWYQSSTTTTDDYATRIWADMTLQRQEWVLVTVLFDESIDWSAPETQRFLSDLHQIVAETRS